jgi:hypothetical protein
MRSHPRIALLLLCLAFVPPALAARKGFREAESHMVIGADHLAKALSDERVLNVMGEFAGSALIGVKQSQISEYGDGDGGGFCGYSDVSLRFLYGRGGAHANGGHFDVLFTNGKVVDKVKTVTRPHFNP